MIPTIYNVKCIEKDFYYLEGNKTIINKGQEFLAIPITQVHPKGHIFFVYELYELAGTYLGIFGVSSFSITKKNQNNMLYTSLMRNKKIFQILEN
jgi:hypothetical protein